MEREQIIKALKCCINHEGDNCHICPYHYTLNGFNHNCKEDMCEDALAFIKELIDSEDYWKRQTFDACMDKGRMHDKIKELAQESQKWQEAYDCADSACRELSSKCDELTEENEKLNERINREARCQYDLCGQIVTLRDDVKYIKADAVQKMQERFSGEMYNYGDSIDTDTAEELINQISKEMLEENK